MKAAISRSVFPGEMTAATLAKIVSVFLIARRISSNSAAVFRSLKCGDDRFRRNHAVCISQFAEETDEGKVHPVSDAVADLAAFRIIDRNGCRIEPAHDVQERLAYPADIAEDLTVRSRVLDRLSVVLTADNTSIPGSAHDHRSVPGDVRAEQIIQGRIAADGAFPGKSNPAVDPFLMQDFDGLCDFSWISIDFSPKACIVSVIDQQKQGCNQK